jgi:hypothetical protein
MYINVIHHKQFQQKIPPTTLVLKNVCNFSYFVTSIISSYIYIYIPYVQILQICFFLNDLIKSKSI